MVVFLLWCLFIIIILLQAEEFVQAEEGKYSVYTVMDWNLLEILLNAPARVRVLAFLQAMGVQDEH